MEKSYSELTPCFGNTKQKYRSLIRSSNDKARFLYLNSAILSSVS